MSLVHYTVVNFLSAIFIPILTLSSFAFGEVQMSINKQIEYIVMAHVIEDGFQGNILVTRGKYPVFEKSYGFASIEHQVTHTAESKFMIASLSKQFTSAAILLLVQRGKLHLDDPISDFFDSSKYKGLPSYWNSITLRHLMTHTAGLQKDLVSPRAPRGERNSLSTLVREILNDSGNFFEGQKLGAHFSYSNMGYVLLAQVIEKVGGTTYDRFLRKQIFEPLGLLNTGEYHELKVLPHMSDGYYQEGGGEFSHRCCEDATNLIGSHSLYSTAQDLNLWTRSVYGDLRNQQSVFEQETLEEFRQTTVDATNIHGDLKPYLYGFGVMSDNFEGEPRYWHDGQTAGFLSALAYLPSIDATIVILTNFHRRRQVLSDFYNWTMLD
ncbi:MAG: beta-lactamase family protein, partial [Bdellovibrionales bacterium]|nr:beta-lactamase family protein [Bdellovibrionales bacterium]